MSDLILSNAIGFVVGLAGSFFSWWILVRGMVPSVEFSPTIKRVRSTGADTFYYRVALKNAGWRGIIDVHIYAQLSVSWDGGNEWARFYVPLNPSGDRKFELPRLGKNHSREFRLFPGEVPDFANNPGLTPSFQATAADSTVTAEEMLALGDAANLRIIVLGYDEFSGARRLFESRLYQGTDILEAPHSPVWTG